MINKKWMDMAILVGQSSKCIRRHIGAVIVDTNEKIISTGFNGPARGEPHCVDIGCIRDKLGIISGNSLEICNGIHAEINAIIQAGKLAKDSTLYVNAVPCIQCTKVIINAEIRQVVYSGSYGNDLGLEILKRRTFVFKLIL